MTAEIVAIALTFFAMLAAIEFGMNGPVKRRVLRTIHRLKEQALKSNTVANIPSSAKNNKPLVDVPSHLAAMKRQPAETVTVFTARSTREVENVDQSAVDSGREWLRWLKRRKDVERGP